MSYKPLSIGSKVGSPPELLCEERRCVTRMTPKIPGLWATYAHRNCTCNEYLSLRNRVLGAVPRPTRQGIKMLYQEAKYLARQIPTTVQMSDEKFCDHYSGKRKRRYLEACESLILRPLELPNEAGISAFVKAEKNNPLAKENPDPRMIQARNARYNATIGKFLKPIEHHLYRLRDDAGFPLLAKGLNPVQRGNLIREAWESFRNPVAICLDGKRWDQHCAKEVLEVEHWFYLASNNDPFFKYLLSLQIKNKCKTSGGWRYKTNGGRMSGDMNTALGNCLLMLLMVMSMLRKLGIRARIIDDGDDVFLIIEQTDLKNLIGNVERIFLMFGQEVKVESIAYRLEDIEFCQARPIVNNVGETVMVADWRKIISQSTAGTRFWDNEKTRIDMAFSVGQCLLALYPGIPVIQTYAQKLCEQGKLNSEIFCSDWIWKVAPTGKGRLLGQLRPEVITPETRESFMKAYKLDPEQQQLLEKSIESWELPKGLETRGQEVGGQWHWEHCLCHQPTPWEW